jgi:NAD(P)-dependent dehydrogenase (short-subunit alcohol dehydrogenase family)
MGEYVHEITPKAWSHLFEINATTFLNVVASTIPPMVAAGEGKVLAVGSYGAQREAAGAGAYAASKRALQALVEALSEEQKENGINVNLVLPSIIDTPANRVAMPEASFEKWVKTSDLADVLFYLASNEAKSIHGAAIPVRNLV